MVNPYFPYNSGKLTVRETEEDAGMGSQKKQKVICNELHKDCNIILPEKEQTSDRSFIAREFVELLKKGKQMSVRMTCAPKNHTNSWHDIDWKKAHRKVRKLQVRIAKATKEGRYNKVKSLQWILTHSFSAKVIAVKRVTESQGKTTPGVDGITWCNPKLKIAAVKELQRRGYRTLPLRRIYIPKKNGKKRALPLCANISETDSYQKFSV